MAEAIGCKIVSDATQEAIEVISPTGRLIVGPGCALPADTPPENVYALIEAARSYGRA